MLYYDYLLIGGGQAADAAAKGIRELDQAGSIGLISDDTEPPYARPPLSKKLWQGKPLDIIWRGTAELGVKLHLGRRVGKLDRENKTVTDNLGGSYGYGKLLLSTGGTPRRLPFAGDDIIYFRTLQDYRRLRGLADAKGRIAVVGGGFIGAEIAAALAMNGCEVVQLFPESTICSRVFPGDLADYVTEYYRGKGVRLFPGETVVDLGRQSGRLLLRSGGGGELPVDGVVAGLGIELNLELAIQAGLALDNGIVVDELLATSAPDIYAAGDVAAFFSQLLKRRVRVEHEDNAVAMGHQAGRNMAGAAEPYIYQPFFYSDLFDLGYEAVGELDSRLETVAEWSEKYRKGVIYYLRDGRVRGVLLWNVWEQLDAARRIMAEPGPFSADSLTGVIPVR